MPSDIRVSGYAGSVDSAPSVGSALRGNESPSGFDSLLRLPPQLQPPSESPASSSDATQQRPLQSLSDRPAYAESARSRPNDARDDQQQVESQSSTDGSERTTEADKPADAPTRAEKREQTAANDAKADDGAVNSSADADDVEEEVAADDAAALAAAGAAGVQVTPIVPAEAAPKEAVSEQSGAEPITSATATASASVNANALTTEVAGAAAAAATRTEGDAVAVPADGPANPAVAVVEPVQQVETVTDAPNLLEPALPATAEEEAAPTDGEVQLEKVTTEEVATTATAATPTASSAAGATAASKAAAAATADAANEPPSDTQSSAQLEPSAAATTENARAAVADEKQDSDNDKPKRDEQKNDESASAASTSVASATFDAAASVDKSGTVGEAPTSQPTDSSASAQPARTESSSSAPPVLQMNPVDAGVRPSAPVRLAAELLGGGHRASSDSQPVEINSARFLHRVASAFVAAEQRGGEVRLRLSPPELGGISVEVKLHEGALTARVETETTAAKTAVVEHLSQLRERLAEQGVRIERFDVDVRQQGSTGTPNGPGQQQDDLRRQAPRTPRAPSSAAAATDVRRPANWVSNGSLNVIV